MNAYAYTWKGVLQANADGTPRLFPSRERAKAHNRSRCKIVRVRVEIVPPKPRESTVTLRGLREHYE